MKKVLLITIILLKGYLAFPQVKWTLLQCIDTALHNNLTVKQYFYDAEISKTNYAQSRLNLLPAINGSASQGFNSGRSLNPVNYQFTTGSIRTNNFSVTGSVVLFNGLQNHNRIKESQANFQAANYDLEDQENQITLNVVNDYLQILSAYELVKTSESQVETSNSQLTVTQNLVNAGKQPELNLLQIKSQLANDKMTLVSAQAQLNNAKLALQQLMYIPVTDSFNIDYTIPEIPLNPTTEKVPEIYQQSLSIMPNIKANHERTISQEYALKVTKGTFWPRLSLNGNIYTNYSSSKRSIITTQQVTEPIGYLQSNTNEIVLGTVNQSIITQSNADYMSQLKQNLSKAIQLTLSIPIFNNSQVWNNIRIQQFTLMNSKLNEQQGNVTLRMQIEQAYNDMQNSRAKYDAAMEALNAERASYESTEVKYDAGLLNATDLLIEKNKLFSAESNLILAKYDLIFKIKILDYYEGKKIVL